MNESPGSPLFTQLLSSDIFHGVLRPQKPYGLLAMGEEWDKEREPRPTALFTQPLSSAFFFLS